MENIRNLLLGTSIAVGLTLAGGSAYAADLPVKAAPSAPVPEAASNYISVFGGYSFAGNLTARSSAYSFDLTAPFNNGYIIGATLGTHLMPNLRGEVEVSYASHGSSGTIFATGSNSTAATGSISTLYLLGNLWYDIDLGSGITPYLGGGVGAAVVMPNIALATTPEVYNTDAWALAAQLGAGIKFQLADNLSVDLGYRAKKVFNASLTGSGGAANLSNVSYVDQSVQIGLDLGF